MGSQDVNSSVIYSPFCSAEIPAYRSFCDGRGLPLLPKFNTLLLPPMPAA